MSRRPQVGVLISGRGSNMGALIAAADAGAPFEIAVVISNDPSAEGLAKADAQGVANLVIDHRLYGQDRTAFERDVDAALREYEIEMVALAGFMRVLTPFFVNAWAGRLINIHPSLLPAFPGLHTHRRALKAGVKLHGCTVHWVSEEVDHGPAIGQAAVPVRPDDTPETLAARVLKAEHVLYPLCLALALQGPAAGVAGFGPAEEHEILAAGFLGA